MALHYGKKWWMPAPVSALCHYGPFGNIADLTACEDQFLSYLMGCVGTGHCIRTRSPLPNRYSAQSRKKSCGPNGSSRLCPMAVAVMIDGKMG